MVAVATEVNKITQGENVCNEKRTVLTTEPQGRPVFRTVTRNELRAPRMVREEGRRRISREHWKPSKESCTI